jgi:hypothetical protein
MLTRLTYGCLALLLLSGIPVASVRAQDKQPTFEFGLHYTALHLAEKSDSDSGPGLRFTYNLNDYFAVEAEGNALPQTREGGGNNEAQGFFGARVGIRKARYGIFAKVRPGFNTFYLLGVTPGPNVFEQGHTRFALDAGGVFEYYPSRNTALRVDAGDTMIQFKPGDFFYQRLDEPMAVSRQFSHHLQISVGFSYRF